MLHAMVSTVIRILLRERASVGEAVAADSEQQRRQLLLGEQAQFAGRRARALTPLRPVGIIKLDGKRHDAESVRAYIEPGEEVEILHSSGYLLVVQRIEP